jgi:hypothetical protein
MLKLKGRKLIMLVIFVVSAVVVLFAAAFIFADYTCFMAGYMWYGGDAPYITFYEHIDYAPGQRRPIDSAVFASCSTEGLRDLLKEEHLLSPAGVSLIEETIWARADNAEKIITYKEHWNSCWNRWWHKNWSSGQH